SRYGNQVHSSQALTARDCVSRLFVGICQKRRLAADITNAIRGAYHRTSLVIEAPGPATTSPYLSLSLRTVTFFPRTQTFSSLGSHPPRSAPAPRRARTSPISELTPRRADRPSDVSEPAAPAELGCQIAGAARGVD